MRIKLEAGHSSTKSPPAFTTVDELPDVGETLRTENSDVFELVKITRTLDRKEHDKRKPAVVERVSAAEIRDGLVAIADDLKGIRDACALPRPLKDIGIVLAVIHEQNGVLRKVF